MRLPLTRLENIALTIIITPLTPSPLCLLLLLRLGGYTVNLCAFYFYKQSHRETDRFFAASGVQLAQHNCGKFHYRRAAFSSQLKSKIWIILAKAAALLITLNIDGAP
jgi:hypothetical protein